MSTIFGGQDFEDLGGTVTGKVYNGKGVGKLWNMIMDNLARLFVSNLICIAAAIPGVTGMALGYLGGNSLLLLLSGLVLGLLLGPFYGCMMDGILVALRGFPGNWWPRYKMVLKRDWKSCLLPGLLTGVMLAIVLDVLMVLAGGGTLPMLMLWTTGIALVLFLLYTIYVWPQRVLLDLRFHQILKNCLPMFLAHFPTTLGALAIKLAYWALMLILFPYSTIFLLVLGVWFPALMATCAVYKNINHDFKIEERLGIVPPEEPEEPSDGEADDGYDDEYDDDGSESDEGDGEA